MVSSSYTSLPVVSDSFEWTDQPWGVALRCRPLALIASHLFTTRQYWASSPDDLRALGRSIGARDVATVRQVHGRDVVVVESSALDPTTEADGLLSGVHETAVAVRAADCIPLLMADRTRGVVAAVHAGWRGTAASVGVAAVDAMGRAFGSRPAEIVAAIGPSIGACCYEVGSELVDAFAAAGHERHLIDRWFLAPPPRRGSIGRPGLRLDLPGANRDQLLLAGIPDEQIHVAGLCTAMHLDVLTSYRRERDQADRLIGVIRPGHT